MSRPYFYSGPTPQQPPEPKKAVEPWDETRVVGTAQTRVDAYERTSGSAVFPSDVSLPSMLHAAIVRCPHSHATVRKVETSDAERMPGVHAVITDASPGANIPWYEGEKGPTSRLFDPHCRYEGEEVAAVAAETPQQAWDAVRSIKVDYEVLPFVSTSEEALGASAPSIHEGGNRTYQPIVYERGDIAKGLAEADVVVEETYRTSCEIHTPMEVHGSVANWDGNRLTVWDSTQGVYEVQGSLAAALKLPLSHVRVIGHYMGGGFGSKLEIGKYTVIAALLAKKAARPVRLFLTREESFLCVGNRPSNTMVLKAGVKKDGTLTALQLTNVGCGGAYPAWAGVGSQVADLYLCPNVRVEENTIYINAGQARAMRAPGFPQCNWALEQMIDALAEKIGMDPVAFRLKNAAMMSQRQNKPYTSVGLKECLERGAKEFGWEQARRKPAASGVIRRGVGMACCYWGWAGGPPSTAIVKLFADGSVNLNMGASDIGTGTKTVMSMIVSEELGVPLERIHIEHADTGTTQFATPSGGSKTVPSDGPAVRAAALEVKRRLLEMAAEDLKVPVDDVRLADGEAVSASDPQKKVAVSKITGLSQEGLVVGIGRRGPNPADKVVRPFAAQFAEVEVNMRTGELRVVRMLAAQDSGRVMNRITYENQVQGGITMGIGFALTERRILDVGQSGRMVNASWHDYKIPTAMDVPADLVCLPVDPHDTECNTIGAKGLGEPATIATAGAIANAVYHATGIRFTAAPISPKDVVTHVVERSERG